MAEFDMSDIEDGTLDVNAAGEDTVPANLTDIETNKLPVKRGEVESEVQTDTQEPPVKAKNLRDTISSALKGETDTPDVAQIDGVRRNPDGTFAPKGAEVPAASAQVISAPPFLSPQEQEVFAKLPPEMQTSVARTFDSLAEREARTRGLEQVDSLLAPRREAWALNGMTEAQALNQLLALSEFATRDPQEFVKYFASQNQIDLEALVWDDEPVDPQYKALQDELSTVKGQLEGFSTAQQQANHNALVNGVISFAKQVSSDGTLLRPHMDALGDRILPYIEVVRATKPALSFGELMQEAYDMACWGTPEIRSQLTASQSAAQDANRIKESQEKAVRARNAGASVAPGVPAANTNTKTGDTNKSVRDTVRAAIAAAS